MSEPILDELCRELELELAADGRGRGVADLLAAYAREHDDWRALCHFSAERYTRNLVHRCGRFELLLLCWEADQESPIHDHAGQQCWMAVLEGELEEVHFREPDGRAPLLEGRRTRLSRGGVAYIQDSIALHLIRPTGGERGISLHLYSEPIDRCRVYDPATGEATDSDLGYTTLRGRPTDMSAAALRDCFR